MSAPQISSSDLIREAHDLLASLGEGEMSESAYDTAWVARLPNPSRPHEPQYPAAYDWLLLHQHPDGSWGAAIESLHDRLVSTLAALLTLIGTSYRRPESEPAARRAILYLNREGGRVRDDPAETVGFELILPELARQAQEQGIRLPYGDWAFIDGIRDDKLRRIPPVAVYGGPTPLTHSFEYLGERLVMLLAERCRFANGSYGISPSATAFVHLQTPTPNTTRYLNRLLGLKGSGSVPYVHPFEIFETSWVLYLLGPLATAARATPALVERLRAALGPMGVAWTTESSVTDADDTAVALSVLTDHGHPGETGVFELFETPDYFQTFGYERDASVTTNAHVLGTLRRYPSTPERRRMILKVTQFLRNTRHSDGYWHDKWHISPYYATDQVVESLAGLANDLVRSAVNWVLEQQYENGAWGFGDGTAEETAWALHTLLGAGDRDPALRVLCEVPLQRGEAYLLERFNERDYPALWIGKSLYTPPNIIRAVILNVLLRCGQVSGRQAR